MEPDRIALWAAAVPAAAAVLALLACRALGGGSSPAATAAAVAVGFVAGHVGGEGRLRLAPVEGWHWLPHLALAGLAAALAETRIPPAAAWLRWTIRAAAALFAAWASVLSRTPLWIGGTAAAVVLLLGAHDAAARRERAPQFTLALALTAAAAALSLFFAGTMRIAVQGGTLAAACGAAWAASRWIPGSARGAAVPGVLLLANLILGGVLLAEMPVATACLLALAPLGALVPDAVAGGPERPARSVAIRLGAVAAIAAAGAAWGAHLAPAQSY